MSARGSGGPARALVAGGLGGASVAGERLAEELAGAADLEAHALQRRGAPVEHDDERRLVTHGGGAGREPSRQSAGERGDEVLGRGYTTLGGPVDDIGDQLRQRVTGGL